MTDSQGVYDGDPIMHRAQAILSADVSGDMERMRADMDMLRQERQVLDNRVNIMAELIEVLKHGLKEEQRYADSRWVWGFITGVSFGVAVYGTLRWLIG